MIPGEIITVDGEMELNQGQPIVTIKVANTGDRPIQVGSHYHFYEVNAALSFDREQARGLNSILQRARLCASSRGRSVT